MITIMPNYKISNIKKNRSLSHQIKEKSAKNIITYLLPHFKIKKYVEQFCCNHVEGYEALNVSSRLAQLVLEDVPDLNEIETRILKKSVETNMPFSIQDENGNLIIIVNIPDMEVPKHRMPRRAFHTIMSILTDEKQDQFFNYSAEKIRAKIDEKKKDFCPILKKNVDLLDDICTWMILNHVGNKPITTTLRGRTSF